MPRRGENIFRRKDGRWEARYVKAISTNNKKLYGSVYASTYTEVKQKRENICNSLNKEKIKKSNINNQVLEYYIVEWLNVYRIKFKAPTYVKYYNVIYNYLLPYFKDIKANELNTKQVELFTASLLKEGKNGKPLSPKTVKDILSLFKSIIGYIESEHNISINTKIIYPKKQKEKERILSKEEFINLNQTLLQEIDSCKFGVLIAMATGLRIGELCALKWKDISLKENYIYVNKTMQRIKNIYSDNPKTIFIEDSPKSSTSNRKIPIPANLITLFKQFRQNDDCYLLTGRSDKFVEPRSLERKFRKYIKNAGIEKANFHMLRHTFATMCIEGGFEIKCLSEILGHSGSQITLDRYVHSSFDLKKSWIDKFSNQNISCH